MKWPRLTRRSLFGRSVFAILGFMLLFQIITYSITATLIVWPLIKTSTGDLADLIALSANTLAQALPERRAALAQQLGTRYRMEITLDRGPGTGESTAMPFVLMLHNVLTQKLGSSVQVMKSDNRYSVSVPVAGEWIRFSFPHSRIGTNPYLTLWLMIGVTLFLSLAASVAIAFKLTGHLRAMGRAAACVGEGSAAQLDVQAGVEELDELVQNFNRMAQQVNAMMQHHTTLLAGISHDLRSPLTRAKLALELAEAAPDAARLADLGRYLEQMEKLIADFLDFSRGVVIEPDTELELSSLVAQICLELSTSGSVVNFTGQCGSTRFNRSALNRVLHNLIENAQRYGGGIPVEVSLSLRPASAMIEVRDHGPGIPEAERERVFLPFVRLETSRNPATGGSGLGLAIVKEICRVHRWQIVLFPREGGGLTACLEIPLEKR